MAYIRYIRNTNNNLLKRASTPFPINIIYSFRRDITNIFLTHIFARLNFDFVAFFDIYHIFPPLPPPLINTKNFLTKENSIQRFQILSNRIGICVVQKISIYTMLPYDLNIRPATLLIRYFTFSEISDNIHG